MIRALDRASVQRSRSDHNHRFGLISWVHSHAAYSTDQMVPSLMHLGYAGVKGYVMPGASICSITTPVSLGFRTAPYTRVIANLDVPDWAQWRRGPCTTSLAALSCSFDHFSSNLHCPHAGKNDTSAGFENDH